MFRALLGELRSRGGNESDPPAFSTTVARELKGRTFDLEAMRQQGYAYERLDQLTIEILLGVR